jgi:GT2 family glycosyltransferase
VCAVTVAYNKPEELANLLSSLQNQHACLSGLVIIDNSDNCFSAQNKKVCDLHAQKYAFTRYYNTANNVGSAGGFRCGMKIAHENGFSWVWLLDQDGAVSSNCLAELLRHADKGDILCPNRVDARRPHSSEPMVFVRNFLGGEYRVSLCVTDCQVVTFGTHGVLISKKALDTIGYYDDSLFFVGYEDHDYGYRAVQKGLVILFVAEAQALHPSSLPTGKKLKIFPAQLNLKFLKLRISPSGRETLLEKRSQVYRALFAGVFRQQTLSPLAICHSACVHRVLCTLPQDRWRERHRSNGDATATP